MPLDPQFRSFLKNAPEFPPVSSMPVDQLRKLVRESAVAFPKLTVPLESVEDRTIPGPAGALPARIYIPQGKGPFPILIYFHGGGWVVGDLDTQDMICRALCHAAGCLVMSVDYRLAPEHKFPAALDDAWAATKWAAGHGREIGGDPTRLAVGGDSAGGALTAGVALRAREEGGVTLRAQLIYYASNNYPSVKTASSMAFAQGPFLRDEDIDFFWNLYLSNPAIDQHNPYASPIRAKSHVGLPPAFVGTAEIDPSRDDGEAYGLALAAAGVPTVMCRYSSMPHGFVSWVGIIDTAQRAVDDASEWLKQRFRT